MCWMKQLHIVTFIFTQQSGCHVEGTVGLHKHDDEKHFVKVQNLMWNLISSVFTATSSEYPWSN